MICFIYKLTKCYLFPYTLCLGTRGFPTEIDTGHIGGNDCVADDPKYFIGRMDSVSMICTLSVITTFVNYVSYTFI